MFVQQAILLFELSVITCFVPNCYFDTGADKCGLDASSTTQGEILLPITTGQLPSLRSVHQSFIRRGVLVSSADNLRVYRLRCANKKDT